MDTSPYKEMLLRKRGEILAEGSSKQITASMDTNTRQGDLADQATGNNEVHIQLKLKQTDAKILQAIEEALVRIEKGTYGVCRDCGEPIAEARLKAIPWTRVCITCKEKQKARPPPNCSACCRTSTATRFSWFWRARPMLGRWARTTPTTRTNRSLDVRTPTCNGCPMPLLRWVDRWGTFPQAKCQIRSRRTVTLVS